LKDEKNSESGGGKKASKEGGKKTSPLLHSRGEKKSAKLEFFGGTMESRRGTICSFALT